MPSSPQLSSVRNTSSSVNSYQQPATHPPFMRQPPTAGDLPSHEEREKAIREAKVCLEALDGMVEVDGFQLDGFNLLGVVANPRLGGNGESSTSTATAQQPQQTTQLQLRGISSEDIIHTDTTGTTTPGILSDAYQTFESTLAQVTEQIESLNVYLEELSRQYLGGEGADEALYLEYYYQTTEEEEYAAGTNEHHQQQLHQQNVLANLDLQDLQEYLEECGVLAHTLLAHGLKTRTRTLQEEGEDGGINEEDLKNQLQEIPAVFYEPDFDLTDSKTFADLLLRPQLDDEHSAEPALGKTTNPLYQPTQEMIPVGDQDVLAGHLDKVELALQEQVRQKSTAFFHETTRFRQLQASIEDLLSQVQDLRSSLQFSLQVYRQTKDISDHQKQDYEILLELLDGSMELIRCKASIGGLLSANDHLGAALQIQYGRKLLQGKMHDSGRDGGENKDQGSSTLPTTSIVTNQGVTNDIGFKDSNLPSNTTTSFAERQEHQHSPLELRLIHALSTCETQFSQYESLVVQNLSEDLVEVFFHWKANESDRVKETVKALQVCASLHKTAELYQRRLQQLIRMTVRTTIAEFLDSTDTNGNSSSGGVTGMTHTAFFNCLQLLLEEVQSILAMARRVDDFCASESIFGEEESNHPIETSAETHSQQQQQRWTKEALAQGAELATKSIAELLRLRKEAHSVVSLAEMKELWDTCIEFTIKMEVHTTNDNSSNSTSSTKRAVSLRSTLIGQAKAFLDRTHESNMSALVAALDSERWGQCEVSYDRQVALTRLCSGLATVATPRRKLSENGLDSTNLNSQEKKPVAIVEGVSYKVVWSCLLLVEMIMTNLSSAAYFQQSLATNAVTKVVELMRLFNSRTTNLVLGAGAIHSAARLKSINAKHLSYVTQCLGMTISLLPHIRAALMAQLPTKQHTLLNDLDSIKNEYKEHNEKVLNKFVSIIGGIVEHGLAPRIAGTDFDDRATKSQTTITTSANDVECFVFLDGIYSSTRKLHHVLNALLPPDHLQDVFSRIFAHLDQQIPGLLITKASTAAFSFPSTREGKHRLLLEIAKTTKILNELGGVLPWEFTARNVLERKLEYHLPSANSDAGPVAVNEPSVIFNEDANDENDDDVTDTSIPDPQTSTNKTVVKSDESEIASNEVARSDSVMESTADNTSSECGGHVGSESTPDKNESVIEEKELHSSHQNGDMHHENYPSIPPEHNGNDTASPSEES